VLEGFNTTQAEYPGEQLLQELFEEQVRRTPQAVAVTLQEQSLSYAQLNERSNQLARYLRAQGVGGEDLVGICVERGLEMVVGLLGILKAGAAYVPLDPNYPAERVEHMVRDAAPKVLLTQQQLRGRLEGLGSAQVVALDEQWEQIAGYEGSDLDARALGMHSGQLAYVIYTSGSTGKPKGAMNEHRAVINRLWWMQKEYELDESDRVLQKTPFSFDVSVWEFFWPLLCGARLVLARAEGHKDPGYLIELIEQAGITTVHFVPSMLQIFLQQQQAGACGSVRRVICSGEELTVGLQNQCLRQLPQARLSNLYGPTEAAVDVTFWECRLDEHSSRVPIGRPISNIRMYVLDGRGEVVPVGVVGEIHIGGVGVGRGYLNRPELTAQRFIADAFGGEGARLYRTGDLGRWRADGALEYLGRNDDQVKIRGFRIELGEIQAQVVQQAGVKDAVVVAREDEPGEKRLVAYVVGSTEGEGPSVERMREQLKAVLPEHMVPSAFVVLASLPLTPSGKLDRRALPAPQLSAYTSRQYQAPRGEVEEILAGIWQELLHLERVGRQDNFFELGGHSLLIVQMLERLRRIGLSSDVRGVFQSATLSDLARALVSEASEAVVPANLIPAGCERITAQMLPLVELQAEQIERIVRSVPGGAANIQDIYPLAPLQEGILFHHLLQQEQGVDPYVISAVLTVPNEQRLNLLLQAMQAASDRHDILRTAVLWEQLPCALQVVYRGAELPVHRVALQPTREPLAQIKELMGSQRQRLVFDALRCCD
jgi:amino acid adenylation domain-containing protein